MLSKGLNPPHQYQVLTHAIGRLTEAHSASHLAVFNFWIQLSVGVALLIGAIWGALKFVDGLRRWWHRRHTLEVAEEVKQTLDPTINHLVRAAVSELLPNGGGSVKDRVTAIDGRLSNVEVKIASLDAKVDVALDLLGRPLVRQPAESE